ncbi:hypothetical protein BKA24_002599 [Microbacterium marinum]|uniref:Uncharacterized protein n=1 Tax=Microbacterium marinum TaxID=421115 RepID=A0A7W7BS76_9MICO|nr:hypothetical protein [Microbacterium marinum]MBB4667890.1 hypothetical protein [Microbacterium marinum]
MTNALDAILEIFSWVGFGAAFAFGIAAVVVWAADGSWLPAEAYLDDDGLTARWIDADGEVNSAPLTADDVAGLAGADRAQIWYRHGWRDRMRTSPRPPILRLLWGLSLGGFVVGAVAVIGSFVALFLRG